MGLAGKTGSLTPGKQADLIAVRIDRPHVAPVTDPYSALVYSSRGSDVALTIVDGNVLYGDGVWRTLDAPAIFSHTMAARARLIPQS